MKRLRWRPTLCSPSFAPTPAVPASRSKLRDISLVGRMIANFPDNLTEEQKIPDHLAELGQLVKSPEANIIKLPNISASIPQLQSALSKSSGKRDTTSPTSPKSPGMTPRRTLRERFAVCLGSAVNPVLREGNCRSQAGGVGQELRTEASTQDDEAVARIGIQIACSPHGAARTSSIARGRPP